MNFTEENVKNIIVGSGAAGYAAAVRLHQLGERDTVLLAENRLAGTSRNTGSDKQTYYKLSLAGGDPDSVVAMAEDLYAGGCVDGDIALCEAALSMRGFYHLAELGVPFPYTEYGEYMGYKTDHDRGKRATSAGPYTSKMMTEVLEQRAEEMGVRVADQSQVIKLLVLDDVMRGVLVLEKNTGSYKIYWAQNVILATGGPAGIYYDSVYPESQIGSTGLAFEAGASGKNLTEWQFGLASTKPRWNVSGTYMQVLPRFISIDEDGTEHEFLLDYFANAEEMLSKVFLKGYQWPFDVSKIFGGSSIIDLLVYQESILKGRKVYLDFIHNPCDGAFSFDKLEAEAYQYLYNAKACFGTPYDRLALMNMPAIDFYLDHKVDLSKEYLPIAICAQHNNGGIAGDAYWETEISGLFAIGECNGSHGVTRPGGTALNAGQVGAMRAAEAIRLRNNRVNAECAAESNLRNDGCNAAENVKSKELLRNLALTFIESPSHCSGDQSLSALWLEATKRMSALGGMIRKEEDLRTALGQTSAMLENLTKKCQPVETKNLGQFYHLRDILITQTVYLSAMLDYIHHGGKSRGSALYSDPTGQKPDPTLPDLYSCKLDDGVHSGEIQEIKLNEDYYAHTTWRSCRPLPQVDYFFENQWRAYRERL